MTAWRDAQPAHNVLVEHAHPTRGDGAHGQFFVPRRPELAHQEHVQGGAERTSHLIGHHHPAPWQAQHDHILTPRIGSQLFRQFLASIPTIPKDCHLHLTPLPIDPRTRRPIARRQACRMVRDLLSPPVLYTRKLSYLQRITRLQTCHHATGSTVPRCKLPARHVNSQDG